jgi:hypothetical protein
MEHKQPSGNKVNHNFWLAVAIKIHQVVEN